MRGKVKIILAILILLPLTSVVVYFFNVPMPSPLAEGQEIPDIEVKTLGQNHSATATGSWLHKNDKDVWEIYR